MRCRLIQWTFEGDLREEEGELSGQKPDGVRMFMSRCFSLWGAAFFPSTPPRSILADLKLAGSSTERFTWVLMPSRVVDFGTPKYDCRLNPPGVLESDPGSVGDFCTTGRAPNRLQRSNPRPPPSLPPMMSPFTLPLSD